MPHPLTDEERTLIEHLRTVISTPAEVTDGEWDRRRSELGGSVPRLLDIIERLVEHAQDLGELDPA